MERIDLIDEQKKIKIKKEQNNTRKKKRIRNKTDELRDTRDANKAQDILSLITYVNRKLYRFQFTNFGYVTHIYIYVYSIVIASSKLNRYNCIISL